MRSFEAVGSFAAPPTTFGTAFGFLIAYSRLTLACRVLSLASVGKKLASNMASGMDSVFDWKSLSNSIFLLTAASILGSAAQALSETLEGLFEGLGMLLDSVLHLYSIGSRSKGSVTVSTTENSVDDDLPLQGKSTLFVQ